MCVCVCLRAARPVIFDIEHDGRPMGDLGDCFSLRAGQAPISIHFLTCSAAASVACGFQVGFKDGGGKGGEGEE